MPRCSSAHLAMLRAGSMPSVIRALVHYYAPFDHAPSHTYLREAQKLRSDLKAAQ